jgi:hypothetical protein
VKTLYQDQCGNPNTLGNEDGETLTLAEVKESPAPLRLTCEIWACKTVTGALPEDLGTRSIRSGAGDVLF